MGHSREKTNTSRRVFLKGLIAATVGFSGLEVASGFFKSVGSDVHNRTVLYLRNMYSEQPVKKELIDDLWFLYGNQDKPTGILPGNLNRHLFAQGVFRTSRFNKTAYDAATNLYVNYFAPKNLVEVGTPDMRFSADNFSQLLIIGGPIESDATLILEGYETIITPNNPTKPLPIVKNDALLPFNFYCGNGQGWGYWEDEYRSVRRWREDHSEGEFPLYGLMDRKNNTVIPPLIEGNRLASDMLSITRLPHPHDRSGGYTIISGLHGYSFEAFFRNIDKNIKLFSEIFKPQKDTFFQALVPLRLNPDHSATIEWKSMGNGWEPRFEKIDPADYLSKLQLNVDVTNG